MGAGQKSLTRQAPESPRMFVPLQDDNRLKSIKFQYVTIGIIVLNVLFFLLEQTNLGEAVVASGALIPGELLKSESMPPTGFVPEPLTLISYMFFHGSWLHLIGNMLFLWVFGDNVEDAMGHVKYLFFYLACGVFAGLVHTLVANSSLALPAPEIAAALSTGPISNLAVPLIGASGAVAGVIAAYLMLHPKVQVWVLALKFFPMRISAMFALGLWVVMQLVMVLVPQPGQIAWWAHIGGLIAGAVLVVFLRRPGVPLFDKGYQGA
jgi:membrane associated rhomboid family serine protease